MLLFPIRTTTFFFSFSFVEQKEQLDANLKINILYLDQYIDDCFQDHQSQYCWELSPDLSQPKIKIKYPLQNTLWVLFFPPWDSKEYSSTFCSESQKLYPICHLQQSLDYVSLIGCLKLQHFAKLVQSQCEKSVTTYY